MPSPSRSPIVALLDRVLPRLKYPHLFLILAGLLAVDVVVPDPIPLLDEMGLALLTFLVASWRTRREPVPPPRDVTPASSEALSLPSQRVEPTEEENDTR